MEKNGFLSSLTTVTSVMIVANDKLEGKPLVTKLMDKDGNPKLDLNQNEIGSIRLEQHIRSLSGSYLNARRRVAFVAGSYDELVKLVETNKWKNGSLIPGKIVITESLQPMWEGQNPKMNPQTSEVIGVKVNDRLYPVYYRATFTENADETDKLIRTPEDVNAWYTVRQKLSNNDMGSTTETKQPAVAAAVPGGN